MSKEKQLKDYLHLYLGCEVIRIDAPEEPVVLNGEILHYILSKDKGNYKPILRPLRGMKEQESIEIGMYKKKEHWHELSWEEAQIRLQKALASKKEIEFTANEVMLLLKKHFDLFGLIESGLAIEKTQTP